MRLVVAITMLSAFALLLLAILAWYKLRPKGRREEDTISMPKGISNFLFPINFRGLSHGLALGTVTRFKL